MPETRDKGHWPDEPIELPPIFQRPPRPLAFLRWIFTDVLYPWGFLFFFLAWVSWQFLTPSMVSIGALEPMSIAAIWLRNAFLLVLIAGSLHWRLYLKRSQGTRFKYENRWPATDNKRFTFNDQVYDNMFWSIASGVTFWTAFEVATLWYYANGHIATVTWAEHPVYLALMAVGVYFWSGFHFEFAHRPLHWPPLYKIAHALHHRNVNTNPWSGISMHPLEHLIYFSPVLLWWFVPVHPVIIILTGIYQGVYPPISHSGFQYLEVGNQRIATGTWFHTLHHKLFEVNYGNLLVPTDKMLGTFHDGTPEAHATLLHRRRARHGS